jgi:hypothetical protein
MKAKKIEDKVLGFDSSNPPDFIYLKKLLEFLSPNHRFFKRPDANQVLVALPNE